MADDRSSGSAEFRGRGSAPVRGARGGRGGVRARRWAPRRGLEGAHVVEVPELQDHTHAGLPDDGWAYKHNHTCEDCGRIFQHTHMRRTEAESKARQSRHICHECRVAPGLEPGMPPVREPDPEPLLGDVDGRLRAYLEAQCFLNRRTTVLYKGLLRKGMFWLDRNGVKSEAEQLRMVQPILVDLIRESGPENAFRVAVGEGEGGAYESMMTVTRLAEGYARIRRVRPWFRFLLHVLGLITVILGTVVAAALTTGAPTTLIVLVVGTVAMAYVTRACIVAWAWQWDEYRLPHCE
jgi:hypothetical protein